MNKTVRVYSDGKIGRGRKATLLKNETTRVLIEFYDIHETEVQYVWFKKVRRTKGGAYWHKNTNNWYYPARETKKFMDEMREDLTPEYYNELFGES